MGWLEWLTQVRQDLANRSRISDEPDQLDVTTAGGTLQRKLLTHPGQQLRPGDT